MKRNLLHVLFFSVSFYAGAENPPMHREQFEEHFATLQNKQFHPKADRSLVQLYDSIYYWHWDTATTGWNINPYQKSINIVYDVNNNLTSLTNKIWNGSAWVNDWLMTATYNANNNQASHLERTWNGSAWVNDWRHIYTYDTNNNQTSELQQGWNGSAWDNIILFTYTYDVNNNKTSELSQHWNGSVWENDGQDIYTYDANNNQTSWLYQHWNGSAWMNDELYTYTYDINNNQTSGLGQTWNGSAWMNDELYIYTYDINNNQTSGLGQTWNGSSWVNNLLITLSYDVNNNRMSELYQDWNGSTWINTYQLSYTFDIDNFIKGYVYKLFDNTGMIAVLGDSSYYYSHTAIGINDLAASDDAAINIYPNPSTGTFTLQLTNQQINNSTITISNMLGEKVYSSIINPESSGASIINLNAPNGVYFVQLRSTEKTLTRKIILSK